MTSSFYARACVCVCNTETLKGRRREKKESREMRATPTNEQKKQKKGARTRGVFFKNINCLGIHQKKND